MGINGLFPKISPACHPSDVVALLRPGLPAASSSGDDAAAVGLPPFDETGGAETNANTSGKRRADAANATSSNTAASDTAAAGPTKKRRTGKKSSVISSSNGGTTADADRRRRRVRVAVDASGWIARAAHGQGTHLLDERTLTNYGRAELTGSVERGSNAAATAAAADGQEGAASATAAAAADQDAAYDEALRQEYTQKCVITVMKRVLTLRDVCLADVLVVLDGASPPIKKDTVGQRRGRRDAAVALRDAPVAVAAVAAGAYAIATGDDGLANDEQQQQKQQQPRQVPSESDRISAAKRAGAATSQIQYEIVHAVMVALQSECIPYLVAPYEADGQLGYLARTGLVDMIVTEDSDLMACGAPCILYKFSDWGLNHGVSGGVVSGGVTGQLFLRSRLGCVPSPLNLMDFTDVMLAALFVAAGCDYCKNLRGIGVVTARKCVKEAFHGYGSSMASAEADADNPISKRTASSSSSRGDTEPKLSKLFRLLYQNGYGGKKMTREERAEYETNFCKALIMYRHPVVFDPVAARCVVVNDPAKGGADPELCTFETYANMVHDPATLQDIVGKILDPARAALIAEGRINARTGRPFGEKKDDDQAKNDGQRGSGETSGTTTTGSTEAATSAAADNMHRAMLFDTGEEEQKEDSDGLEEEGALKQANEGSQNNVDMEDTTRKEVAGTTEVSKKEMRWCRVHGCKKYKQHNCDDMCRAHWKESQEAANDAEDESDDQEEEEMLATQQPQQLEMQAHSQEPEELQLETQTELSETQASPPETQIALSYATQAELPSTQSQPLETQSQEQFTARESLSPATAAATEVQSLTALGTQDSGATSQPATQASSGNGSQLSSSQSQDPDALSPDLLAPSPPQKNIATNDDAEGDGKDNEAEAEEKEPSKSSPKAQRQKIQAQPPPRGIQGVLARLMGRK
mmetsp:Transcript_13767/g.39544  ORF Transcript_13767/g.39544 Transcript_13767/m.39544 type:complete len:925 (+) Transcript_13767:230-3004(+)